MAIDMVIDPDKLHFETPNRGHLLGSRLFGSVFVLIFISMMVWGGMTLSNPDTLPIKQVRIEGDFTRLSPVDLQLLVTDKVRGGFFNLDVDAVRLALLDEPWVSEVIVKRIWPDALRVIVIEQIPVVRWGESGLLNPAGEYFSPEAETVPIEIPLLSGPVGSEQNLLTRFNSMQKQVQGIGFNIASLFLDDRRAWSLHFTNGIKVTLGRRDFEERFNRVLTLIPTTTSGRIDQIESIDMRYTNGFSILWKK
ncbi:MAG: cell division protein FtsQ [Gammaproteobacteria bacterium]|jgi:cell division protein FtsQ